MSKKKPEFSLIFNCFASFGNSVEASFILDPEFELEVVSDIHHSEENARVLTLTFRRTNSKQLGRRIFSLKKEFEQTPQGEVTFDSSVPAKERGEKK